MISVAGLFSYRLNLQFSIQIQYNLIGYHRDIMHGQRCDNHPVTSSIERFLKTLKSLTKNK